MLLKILKFPAMLLNLIKQNWSASALGSGTFAILTDWLATHSLGSIVGVIIFACTGFYSIRIAKLKAIEKKQMVEQNYKDKVNEVAHRQRMRELEYAAKMAAYQTKQPTQKVE
ncbi:MAG: hypothetical protein AAGJ18_24380 [Bacteroidota bacterium]